MSDNVSDLDAYRRRNHPAGKGVRVRGVDGIVRLAVLFPVTDLAPEDARKLGEELIDTADLLEDNHTSG